MSALERLYAAMGRMPDGRRKEALRELIAAILGQEATIDSEWAGRSSEEIAEAVMRGYEEIEGLTLLAEVIEDA